MEFFLLTDDEVLVRRPDRAQVDVLWPTGEWAPYDEGHEDIRTQGSVMSQDEAQRYADERVGRPVDLYAPQLTDKEHAAAIERSEAAFVPNDIALWGSKVTKGAYEPGSRFTINGETFDPNEADEIVGGGGDLSKLHEVSTAETMRRLADEEQAAGHDPW